MTTDRGPGRATTTEPQMADDEPLTERLATHLVRRPRPASSQSEDEPLSVSTGGLVGLAVAGACALFVFLQLRPDLLLADTTPAGGDMGAHVWGPAYLRDNLLGQGRLTGWTPDWYAGFPAYHFYMVVPSLAIVAVNAGFVPLLGVPLAIAIAAGASWATRGSRHATRYRIAAVVLAALLVAVPYGIAFKLVSVSGLVLFPVAAWLMGRLARAPEPVPAFLAVASLFFLFDTNFTIYGGNIASTLAGEFAFSISLAVTLVAVGLALRGMDDSTWRVRSAVVISLIALTHVIPVFFAITALVAAVVAAPRVPRLWPVALAISLALLPIAFADGRSRSVTVLAVLAALVTFGAVVLAEPEVRERARWLTLTGPTAALLSAFWLLPFYLREPFFNDMGWERLDEVGPAMLTVPMKIGLPVAAVGAVIAVALRERIGLVFLTTAMVFAAGVANLGEGPLWNARLLPFFYLSVYFLAAVGAAMVVRYTAMASTESFSRPDIRVTIGASLVALLAGIAAVGVPLRILPFGVERDDGTYRWLAFTSHARSFVPSWTAWNYSGYERKPSYREYHDVVTAMGRVGEIHGCGRAMWEYSPDLNRYGTPMALMLLPHWTDGCIGSMEGLYFESSATTPFHFLNQSMLSQDPSRAQRDLPYQSFDIDRGIAQLQVMGVRYYMAQSDEAIEAAAQHPDLTEIATAQPFVVYEVAGSDLVEPLDIQPVVVSGRSEAQAGEVAHRFDLGWLGQAVDFYNDPASFRALPAEDGPVEWQRVNSLLPADGEPVEPVSVGQVDVGRSSITFTVDQVGTPVLVKASYFPNWSARGAEGPWRAGPNLMVVVPTETEVELRYGRSLVDWLGVLATLVGVAGLVGLASLDRRRRAVAAADPDGDVWSEARGWDESDVGVLSGPGLAARAEVVPARTTTERDGDRGEVATATTRPVRRSVRAGPVDPAGAHDAGVEVDRSPEPTGTTVHRDGGPADIPGPRADLDGPYLVARYRDDAMHRVGPGGEGTGTDRSSDGGERDGAEPAISVDARLSTEIGRDDPPPA